MEAPRRLLWALRSPSFPFASQWNGRGSLTCGPRMWPRLSCSPDWKRQRVCRGWLDQVSSAEFCSFIKIENN